MKSNQYDVEVVEFYVTNHYYEDALLLLKPFVYNITNIMMNICDNLDHPLINFINKLCPSIKYYIFTYYKYYPIEEIVSDITVCIFTLMYRYKNKDKSFLGYMNKAFYYEYCRMLMKQNKEILNHDGIKAFYDNGDANLIDDKSYIENFIEQFDGNEDKYGYLTEKWTSNKLIDGPFKDLNELERVILLQYFQENKPMIEIADILNKHINTISQKKMICIRRLEKNLKINYKRTRRIKKSK